MKHFDNVARQGEMRFERLDAIPKHGDEIKDILNGKLVIGHSEQGHHHVMEATKTRMYKLPDSITQCLLVVDEPNALDHSRSTDTHDSIMFKKGTYLVRRGREHTSEGWRLSRD